MAKNTMKQYPEIQFFGVSCDKYEELCDEYDVQGYPTLRFFKADDAPTSKGIEREFMIEDTRDEKTPREIADILNANSIAATKNEDRGTAKHVVDDNAKEVTKPLSDNGNTGSSKDKKEDQTSKNLIGYSQLYKTAKEKYALQRQGVGKFLWKDETKDEQGRPIRPASYNEMTKGMKQNTPGTTEFRDREQAFRKRIEMSITKKKLRGTAQTLEKGNLPFTKDMTKPTFLKIKKMSDEEELILDVTLSLTVALESGLSMGITDITSKSAMKDWLNLLSVSLPPEWNILKLIHDLRHNFDYATESSENFKSMVKGHSLVRKGWSASCQNKALNLEGFSCGFWKLLHVITLGVAEQRGGQNLIDSGMVVPTTVVFSPALAADTIRNYIDKFFTCKPCREHFLATYDDCNNNRRCERLTNDKNAENPSDWKELSLWLWEVHNDVSVRLVGERISNSYTKGVKNTPTLKDEVSVLVPNINSCIMCFEDDGMWNKAEVFRFLERTYWPDSEKDPLTDKLLTYDDEGSSRIELLWLAVILVVWLVYKMTGLQSYSIHQSLIAARLVVSQGGSSKSRTV